MDGYLRVRDSERRQGGVRADNVCHQNPTARAAEKVTVVRRLGIGRSTLTRRQRRCFRLD